MSGTLTRLIRVLIASPSDLSPERTDIVTLFHEWNSANDSEEVHLTPVDWESGSVPELGDHPQHLLNKQLISKSDLLIAMFWAKIGTPTPTAPSGTIEEIREFIAAKGPKRVMLYFCDRPIPQGPGDIDVDSISKLQDFKAEMRGVGLYESFQTSQDLCRKLYRNLDVKVRQIVRNELPYPTEDAGADTKEPAPSWCEPSYPDPRLRKPYYFGKTLSEISNGLAEKTKAFVSADGVTNDKYLKLGAHIYRSAALSLDDLIENRPHEIPWQVRSDVRSCSTRLRDLADAHMLHLKEPWPVFWELGREISADLQRNINPQ